MREAIKWLQATPTPTSTPTPTPTPTPNQASDATKRLEDNFKRLAANPQAQLPGPVMPAAVGKASEPPPPVVEAKLDANLEAKLDALSELVRGLAPGVPKVEPPKAEAPPREEGSGEGAEATSLRAMLEELTQQVAQLAAQGASREGQGGEQSEGPTVPSPPKKIVSFSGLEGKLEGKLDSLSALVERLAAREPARHAAPEGEQDGGGEYGAPHRPAAAEAEGLAALKANLERISQQVRQAALNTNSNPDPDPNPNLNLFRIEP